MKNFYYRFLFISILTLTLSFTPFFPFHQLQAQCNGVPESDSLELVKFYEALGGDDWTNNDGWLVEPVSEWFGIILSEDGCWVEEINLYSNRLLGNMSNINLPELKRLSLIQNGLHGVIPNFSHLQKLEELYLSRNLLDGNIPDFSNLPNLSELGLNYNLLSGSVPDFSDIPKLRKTYINDNQLSGNIPDFSNLPNLEHLNLKNNQLSGNIPDFLNISKINYLELRNNQLSGSIPNFSNLPDLKWMSLNENMLTGNVPDFSNLPNLEDMSLSKNRLSGIIPDFSNLPNLEGMSLSENRLSGIIPNFSNLPNLRYLFIEDNQLTGYIPNFSNLPKLYQLEVCPNNLVGLIPNFESLSSNIKNTDFSCIQTPTVTGRVFHDLNKNCTQDEGEETLGNTQITTTDNQFYTFTNENGFYTLPLDTGTYQITATPPNFLWNNESCPESYTVTFENYTDTIPHQNFGFTIADECIFLTIDVASPLQRRCFQNSYKVSYCNEGTRTAENPYIELTFPDEIIPLSASIPYSQDGNVFSFDLDALAIGECGSFVVTDSVSCEAVLGSAACVEGRIYPAFLCREVDSLWDGSDIVVEGECVESEYIQFTISNVGEDMQDSVEYRIYENDVLTAQHNLQLMAGGSTELNIAATGATYRLKAAQTAFHPSESQPQVVVELCGDAPYDLGFEFNNILLPDSTTNELESHGFVQYRITPFEDAPKKSIITNLGDIYFDYNQPITTNTVFNTIGIPELDVTLPIELLQFDVYLDENKHAQVTWITASEINNSHFEVQRSSNGRDFAAIGKLAGKGTSSQLHFYEFADQNLPSTTSMVYYRLQQTDFNGQSSFSKVIALTLQNEYAPKVWYHSTHNRIEVMADRPLQLQIFDALGRLVQTFEVREGRQTFDLQGLERGMYVYQLEVGEKGRFLVIEN